MKIKKSCANTGFAAWVSKLLVNIPHRCQSSNGKFKFINEEDTLKGEPFVLPDVNANIIPMNMSHLQLETVNLDKITKIQKDVVSLNTPVVFEHYIPITLYVTAFISTLVIVSEFF